MADNKNNEFDQDAADAAKARASADTDAAKEAKRMADGLRYLTNNVDLVKKQLNSLDRGLKDGSKRAIELGPVLASLRDSLEDLEKVSDDDREAILKNIRAREGEYKSAIASKAAWDIAGVTLSKTIGTVAGGLRSLATSYQGNASTFQTTADLFSVGIDGANGVVQGLAQGMQAAGASMAFLPGRYKAIGVGLDIAGIGLGTFANSLSDATKFGINFLAKELDNSVKSFNQASSAGALFADGITGLRNAAAEAMLTPENFSKLLAENNDKLALYGGTVSNGVTQFSKISHEMANYRTQLMNLGLTTDEIAEGQVGYMQILALAGQAQRTDYNNLAKETKEYLTNLRDLANLTGEDVKKAQDRAKAAALEGDVLDELTTMGGDVLKNQQNFRAAVIALGPEFENMFKQQFKYKAVTGSDAIAYYQSTGLQELMRRAESYIRQGMDPKELSAKLKEDQKELGAQLLADGQHLSRAFGASARLTGEYNEQVKYGSALQQKGLKSMNLLDEGLETTAQGASETGDKLTNNVSKATESMIEFKSAVLTTLNPAISEFATISAKAITEIGDALEKFAPGSAAAARASASKIGKGGGAGGGAGGGGTARQIPEFIQGLDQILPGIKPGQIFAKPGEGIASYLYNSAADLFGGGKATGEKGSLDVIRDLIASVESGPGGYNATVKAGNQNLTDMTLAEVLSKGKEFGAVGRYQFISSTLSQMMTEAGLTPDAKFTPDVQDKLANQLIRDIGYDDYLKGSLPKDQFLLKLASQWRGLPSSPGMSAGSASDTQGNMAHISWKDALEKFEKGGITSGPSLAGEAGPEAVVPLPDGRTIPVKMDMADLINKFDEMIDVLKDHRDTSEKIYKATV